MDNLKDSFLKLAKDRNLFGEHQKVLIALSGGVDSQTLFNLLYSLKDDLGIELGVAHVNHKQRQESDLEERILMERMHDLSIPIFTKSFTGKFTEEAGRSFRYSFFKDLMFTHEFTALVTAHHADDVVETVLMKQIRGNRLRHLGGIRERQDFGGGELIRPLLSFSKSDFETRDFFDDYTNRENLYLRNLIRNQVIPQLEDINPSFKDGLLSLVKEINMSLEVVEENIAKLGLSSDKVNLAIFMDQGEALRNFILQDYLEKFPDLKVGRRQFDELYQMLIRPGQFTVNVSKDYKLIKDNDNFYFKRQDQSLEIKQFVVTKTRPTGTSYEKLYIPKDADFSTRNRQAGDKILINGVNKKIRRYFIDQKISLLEREHAQIIEVNGEVYGILGMVTSDLSKSLKNDKIRDTLYYYER
ncbi:tRNA lysidine(34) synthetase TilS [Streptococcaceae bacterium ESL0729]|nr:tRNA lysidine(34) synthetase TilS [Streptococcaceae bacterium ESL0729]